MSGSDVGSGIFKNFTVVDPVRTSSPTNRRDPGGTCSQTSREWCRICYPGSGENKCLKAYANRCGSDCQHLERQGCSGNAMQQYTLVKDSRKCTTNQPDVADFFFYPKVDNIELGSDGVQVYGKYFYISDLNQTAEATFITSGLSCKKGDGTTMPTGSAEQPDCTHEWNTSNCKFNDKTDVTFYGTYNGVGPWNCDSGTIKWSAESKSGGDAAYGFYVKYKKSSATYTCQRCRFGYTNTNGGKCTCTMVGADCAGGCVYGYTVQNNSCVIRPNFTCNGNTCYCNSGFDSENGCTQCKPGFIAQDNRCVCPDGFSLDDKGTTENTEDDECVIAITHYTDSTGTFTLGPNICEQ